MATSQKNTDMKWLNTRRFEYLKALKIKTFEDLVKRFIKNEKFIRFQDETKKINDVINFNISVAEILFNHGYIDKKERELQNCIYSYHQNYWLAKLLKENSVIYFADAVKKCIKKDGSFHPLGGKNYKVSSNHKLAEILKRTGFLSESKFLKVERPVWKYRKLTEKEIRGIKDVAIPMGIFPEDTQVLLNALYNRNYNYAWCKYQQRISFKKNTSLRFLVEQFIRISPYEDMPMFKSTGHRLNTVYGPWWTDKEMDEIFGPVCKVLREHHLLA